jgi:hypothetical protein
MGWNRRCWPSSLGPSLTHSRTAPVVIIQRISSPVTWFTSGFFEWFHLADRRTENCLGRQIKDKGENMRIDSGLLKEGILLFMELFDTLKYSLLTTPSVFLYGRLIFCSAPCIM